MCHLIDLDCLIDLRTQNSGESMLGVKGNRIKTELKTNGLSAQRSLKISSSSSEREREGEAPLDLSF